MKMNTYSTLNFVAEALVWQGTAVEKEFQGRLLLDGIAPDPAQREIVLKRLILHDDSANMSCMRLEADAAGTLFVTGQIEIPLEAEHADPAGGRYYTSGTQRYQLKIPAPELHEGARGQFHAFVSTRNLQVQATSRECVSFEAELTVHVAFTRKAIVELAEPDAVEYNTDTLDDNPNAMIEPVDFQLYQDGYPEPGRKLPMGRFMNSDLGSIQFTYPATRSILPGIEGSDLTPATRTAVADYDGLPGAYSPVEKLAANAARAINRKPPTVQAALQDTVQAAPELHDEPTATVQYEDDDAGCTYVKMPTRRRNKCFDTPRYYY